MDEELGPEPEDVLKGIEQIGGGRNSNIVFRGRDRTGFAGMG
jgi:hypothetical protein